MKKDKLDAVMEALEGTSIKTCEISSKGSYVFFSRSMQDKPQAAFPSVSAGPAATAPAAPVSSSTDLTSSWVGYFYRSREKGGKQLVKLRDVVKEGQQLGIVITMNVVHAVEAPAAGKISDILVEDGQAVEYGQPLIRIGRE